MALYKPDKYYIGIRHYSDKNDLAFITPDGTDSGAKNRKNTVDRWLRGSTNTTSKVIDNIPLSGFKLVQHRRRWSTQNVVWRVLDPRGYELEISSDNLSNIIQDTIIINGEIQGECCWVRNHSDNILLLTNSEEYKEAKNYGKIKDDTISLKNVKPGYKVIFNQNREGIYLGKFYIISKNYNSSIKISNNKKHVFSLEDKTIYYTSPKILKIIDKSEILSENDAFNLGQSKSLSDAFDSSYNELVITNNKGPHIVWSLEKQKSLSLQYQNVLLINNELYLVSYINSSGPYWGVKFDIDNFLLNGTKSRMIYMKSFTIKKNDIQEYYIMCATIDGCKVYI